MSYKMRQLIEDAKAEGKPIPKRPPPVVYDDGKTKQQFADQCDVNKILKRAEKAGGLSHVNKYPEKTYGEFDGEFGLLEARERIGRADKIFQELPAEVRKEFGNDALQFVAFAGDPANNDKLQELIPAIAEPGRYFPNPVQRAGQGAAAATAPDVAPNAPVAESPSEAVSASEAAPEAASQ